MTLAPVTDVPETPVEPKVLDRFTVIAATQGPTPTSESVRSPYVEEFWLPFLGPCALLFARKCDVMLANLKNGEQSVSVNIRKWGDALGVYPEEIVAAKNRLLRFGLATWEEKGYALALKRHWPAVPEAIATPEHKSVLLSLNDSATE